MPLYVETLPDPVVGTDFTFVVPGQYVWDVLTVTAELEPRSNVVSGFMLDQSGNGRTGNYGFGGNTSGLTFIPGLVDGGLGVQSVTQWVGQVSLTDDPFAGDYTVGFWRRHDVGLNNYTALVARAGGAITVRCNGNPPGFRAAFHMGRDPDGINPGDWFFGSDPIPAGGHSYVWTYVAATGTGSFYLDGALYGSQSFPPHAMTRTTDSLEWGVVGATTTETYDELFLFDRALSAGEISDLYATTVDGWDVYSSAVLALAPFAYWPLEDAPLDGGRQVALEVTDGTRPLLDVAPTFGVSGTISTYTYTWQTWLSSGGGNPPLTLQSIALPQLILPAGYTIGSRTLDLSPVDQWRSVVLWWDSDMQDQRAGSDPFVYPPGAYLNIIPKGA